MDHFLKRLNLNKSNKKKKCNQKQNKKEFKDTKICLKFI